MSSHKYIQINDGGYFHFDGDVLTDNEQGHALLKNFFKKSDSISLFSKLNNIEVLVESHDFPYYVKMVEPKEGFHFKALLPYDYSFEFDVRELFLDEWDRFIGFAPNGVAFVFSRAAQNEFFNQLEEFDDDTITWNQQVIAINNWLDDESKVEPKSFWSQKYVAWEQNGDAAPGWELNQAHYDLEATVAKLKIPKSRVAVLGCGSGNDAAFFAEQGHVVTAFDISEEAIEKAKSRYGNLDINWVVADVFNIGQEYKDCFDIVFEHTCFCAINPTKRNDLVKVWKLILSDEGHLLGYFFVNEKRQGPPYGATEWEIIKRLKGRFEPIYWSRVRNDHDLWRLGSELCIYARIEGY